MVSRDGRRTWKQPAADEVAHRGQQVDGTQALRGLHAVRDLIAYLEAQAA